MDHTVLCINGNGKQWIILHPYVPPKRRVHVRQQHVKGKGSAKLSADEERCIITLSLWGNTALCIRTQMYASAGFCGTLLFWGNKVRLESMAHALMDIMSTKGIPSFQLERPQVDVEEQGMREWLWVRVM